ncbi:VOC family protein [Streptomyces pilosus]
MALVTTGVVVLDCAEPEKLAEFYKELLGADEADANANRVEIRAADGFRLALRRDVNATAPSWPRPENSLQAHLEFVVDDLDAVERRIVSLGGRPIESGGPPGARPRARGARPPRSGGPPAGPAAERGYADPAGHSFVVRRGTPTAPKQG